MAVRATPGHILTGATMVTSVLAGADAGMSVAPQQVELPSMRQPSNAIDSSTDPLPSLHAHCDQTRSTDPLHPLHADCDQTRSKLCSSMPAATQLRQSEVHEAGDTQTEEQQHELCQPQANQPEVQGMKSVAQQYPSVQIRRDGGVPAQIRAQSAERMIMSGDLGTSQVCLAAQAHGA